MTAAHITAAPAPVDSEYSSATVPVPIRESCVFGERELVVIAGPCAIEGESMVRETAWAVRRAGARMLRGGAYKPRTSPHSFAGLGDPALELLRAAGDSVGLPVVTEVCDPRQVERVAGVADMLQIGARNMQNYCLLAEAGRTRVPVLLKRGFSATLREFLLAAEHIRKQGNEAIVLCERGIRTFETASRFTLDVTAVPILKEETRLPVVVDPSHAGGRAALVAPLARAAVAAGADGLMIEVHPSPAEAQSDADQALTFEGFTDLMRQIERCAQAVDRTCGRHSRSANGDS